MAGSLVKSVMLKIVASDGDSEKKLDAITAKADELARKHPELKIKVDSAAASAKLSVLRQELKSTAAESGKTSFSIRGVGLAAASLATGGLSGGISEMGMFQKVLLGLNVATGIGEPLMAGMTVGVAALSAGLVSAGAGAGVFGLAVKGTIARVEAADTANKKLKGSLGELQSGLKGAQTDWNHWITRSAGGVASVLAPALKMVPLLLKDASGFLGPVEQGLRNVVQLVGSGLKSSGFRSLLKDLQSQSGTDLSGLAVAAGNVAAGLGGIVKSFLPYAPRIITDIDELTGKFRAWGQTLSGHSGFQALMSMFKTETPQAIAIVKNLGGVIKNVVSAMTGLSTFSNSRMLLQILGPLSGALKAISGNKAFVNFALYALAGFDAVKKLSSGVIGVSNAFSAMKSAGSLIQGVAVKLGLLKTAQVAATEATKGEAVAQGELDTAMDANPIALIILAVAGLAVAIVELWKHSTGFRNFWKGAWKDIKSLTGDAVNWIKTHLKLLGTIIATVLLGPVAGLVVFIATHWNKIKTLTGRLISDVVSFFKGLPHRIISVLSDLGSLLFSTGKNAVMGFLNGAKSLLGDVLNVGESIGSTLLHGAESFLHIGSPSKVMYQTGAFAGQGFEFGLRDSVPGIASQATRLARAALPSGAARSGGAGNAAVQQTIIIQLSGGLTAFRDELQATIRQSGGDPTMIQRKVKFA